MANVLYLTHFCLLWSSPGLSDHKTLSGRNSYNSISQCWNQTLFFGVEIPFKKENVHNRYC